MRISGVTKVFGGLKAIDNVSCEFAAGKVFILAGPNGAGKTTLLRMIAGLMKPTSGSISFGTPNSELRTGVMMQESYLYRDMTGRENLSLYAALQDITPNRVEDVKDLFELAPFFDHDVDTLSHGQRQRISLARAVLPDHDTLLLDEPFLGIDSSSIADVQKYLVQVKKRGGLVLVATHELELVREIADGLLLMESGRIKYFGDFNI